MGLWMIQSIRRELNGVSYVEGKDKSSSETKPHETHMQGASAPATDIATKHYELEIEPMLEKGQVGFADLIEVARAAEPFSTTINVNDDRLLAPDSMIDEVCRACERSGQDVPRTIGELMRCVYLSLAQCYAHSIADLEVLTGRTFTSLNVVGGGSQDGYLSELTTAAHAAIPARTPAPPRETALGNLAVQMIADGLFDSVADLRTNIAESFNVVEYHANEEAT